MAAILAWLKWFFFRPPTVSPVIEPPKSTIYDPPTPIPPPNPLARVLGIDVAHYQDELDPGEWYQLREKGYKFVFAKASDGATGVDKLYLSHRGNARNNSMLFGPYHFLRFGHDPIKQAQHFFETARHAVGDLPPALDIEWDRYTLDGKYGKDKRMDEWAEEHARKCALKIWTLFGVKPIIYTNKYFFPEKCKYPEFWAQFLCWIPSYADSFKPSGDKVAVPYPWRQWDIWQNDDDLKIGNVHGIDTNVFRGSLDDLKRLIKTH